jgi:hypothetical protein
MTKIAFPTELQIDGPWLIDGERLTELDSVLDKCVEKMRAETKRMLEEHIEARILERSQENHLPKDEIDKLRTEYKESPPQYPYDSDKRLLTVYLSGGRTVEATRFSELVAVANFQNEVPRGFSAIAKVGVTEAKVQLTSTYYTTRLDIRTSPSENEVALENFGLLQNWQVDFGPKRWQQIWLKASWLFPALAFLWLAFGMMLLADLSSGAPQKQIKEEARQLLQQGINSSNQIRAEQLLLEIESDYVPEQIDSVPITSRMWTTLALGLGCLIALCFCPKLSIGIWAGRDLACAAPPNCP